MRRAFGILAVLAVAETSASAEVTKTIRLTQDASGPFAIENLAGTMHVAPGSSSSAEVVATLHAESQAVLDAMRFEATTSYTSESGGGGRANDSSRLSDKSSDKGRPALRVRYPDNESRIRYPYGDHGRSDLKYDGRRIRVSADSGVVAWADLEVRLPKDAHEAWLKNGVGTLTASGVSGTIKFDTGSGDITLSDVEGDILADTGSGNVKAEGLRGRFRCDTGSGECEVMGFRGDDLSLDTGSGSLHAQDIDTRRLSADTGSGHVRVTRTEAREIKADTGSGDVEIEVLGTRLQSVKADTGSGNVHLRLAPDASFEARADMGSGDIRSGFDDAQPILKRRAVVGYRRGDGRIKIDVDTGSGDVVLEPAR